MKIKKIFISLKLFVRVSLLHRILSLFTLQPQTNFENSQIFAFIFGHFETQLLSQFLKIPKKLFYYMKVYTRNLL